MNRQADGMKLIYFIKNIVQRKQTSQLLEDLAVFLRTAGNAARSPRPRPRPRPPTQARAHGPKDDCGWSSPRGLIREASLLIPVARKRGGDSWGTDTGTKPPLRILQAFAGNPVFVPGANGKNGKRRHTTRRLRGNAAVRKRSLWFEGESFQTGGDPDSSGGGVSSDVHFLSGGRPDL